MAWWPRSGGGRARRGQARSAQRQGSDDSFVDITRTRVRGSARSIRESARHLQAATCQWVAQLAAPPTPFPLKDSTTVARRGERHGQVALLISVSDHEARFTGGLTRVNI